MAWGDIINRLNINKFLSIIIFSLQNNAKIINMTNEMASFISKNSRDWSFYPQISDSLTKHQTIDLIKL
ncbi:hypothetical protein BML2537_16180 [Providencia stuartii]|nr:hypothetical protein BML2537_16180 [Providencia stuartii]